MTLDPGGFSKGLQDAERTLASAGAKMKSAGQTLALGVTVPLVAAGGAAAKLAIDAEETASKFNTVLGPAAAAVDAEIGKMMKTIPATREQLRAGVADMTMLGQAAGLTAQEATNLSTKFVTAAGDLGSFNNVPVDQALEAIRSGLVGSSEPLRAFGIDTREAALEAIALEQGLMKAGEEMTAATRAASVMAAIQQDASDAMGDAARTAESTANIMKFLKRDVLELATGIGEQLIPMIRPVIEKFGEWLARFKELSPEAQKVIAVVGLIAAAIGPILIVAGTLATAIGALVPVFVAISAPVAIAIAAAVALGAALVLLWQKSETFRDIVTGAWDAVKASAELAFEGLLITVHALGEAWDWIKQKTEQAWGAIADFFAPIIQEIRETIQTKLIDPVKALWEVWGDDLLRIAGVAWDLISAQLEIAWDAISTTATIAWDTITAVIETAWNVIKSLVEGALTIISNTIQLGLNLIQGDWGEAWENVKGIFEGFKIAVTGSVEAMWTGIRELFLIGKDAVIGLVNGLFEVISRILNSMKTTAITIVKSMWEDIKGVFSGAIEGVRDKMQEVEDAVTGGFTRIWDKVVGNSIWPDMWKEIEGVVSTSTSLINGLLNDWKGTLMGIFDDISGGLIGKVTGLWGDIERIWNGGLQGLLGNLGEIERIYNDVKDLVVDVIGLAKGAGAAGLGAGGAGAAGAGAGGAGAVGAGAGGGGGASWGGTAGLGTGSEVLGGLAGAALVPGIALGASFGGEWLKGKLFGEYINWSEKTFAEGGAARLMSDKDAEMRAAGFTGMYGEYANPIDGMSTSPYVAPGAVGGDYWGEKNLDVTVESPDIYLDGHLVSEIVGRDLTTSILIA